jgi:mono/diheme cytochrome c family protein
MVLRIFFIFFLFLSACSSNEEKKVKVIRDTPKNVSIGQSLYMKNCTSCHGCDGTMGASGAKNLQTSKLSIPEIVRQIKEGKNAMPSFDGMITPEEQKEIAKFTLDLQKK